MPKTRMRLSWLIAFIVLLPRPAEPLITAHNLAQHGHTSWTLRGGSLPGYPRAIAQTVDGYLWVGTEFGLARFDGIRFVSWQPTSGPRLSNTVVVALLAATDGTLWVGTNQGLFRLHAGILHPIGELAGRYVGALVQRRDGTVWAGTTATQGTALLCALDQAAARCHGGDGSLGRHILSLYEDQAETLWVGAANGLWRWGPQQPQRMHATPEMSQEIHAIIPARPSSLLVSLSRAVMTFDGSKFRTLPLAQSSDVKPTALLRDRDGGVWIGTQDQGLMRVHEGRVDRLARAGGLSGDFVVNLLEDREGNVWVGTLGGLDRFRDVAAARVSMKLGLASDTVMAVHGSRDGTVWVSTVGGLNRLRGGVATRFPLPTSSDSEGFGSLLEDRRGRLWLSSLKSLSVITPGRTQPERIRGLPTRYVHAMAEDSTGTIWISDQDRGLYSLSNSGVVRLVPWSTFGGGDARALAADERGGLWLGFVKGGLAYFKDGKVMESVDLASQLGAGLVNGLYASSEALWVATQGGLSHLTHGNVTTIRTVRGLPCQAVQWVIEDNSKSLWAHTACGLIRIGRDDIVKWLAAPDSSMPHMLYDTADGVLRYSELGGYGPKVTFVDGRLWFATYDGVGVVDPNHLPFNELPPPVHIELATADGLTYNTSERSRLPARIRDVRIDYTALSLVAPEKIRFRYKLEPRDREWSDAIGRRQAFYTDLPPGDYRFRVAATNNHGVWNEDGATWDFSIAPTLYQTAEFRVSLVMLAAISVYVSHRVRLRRLAADLNVRFEERLSERTRIARDLHDTLLQGFISSAMQLRLAVSDLADQQVRSKFAHIVDKIYDVVEEGRQTVAGLRAPAPDDLEGALTRDGEYFRGEQTVEIQVAVNGVRRPLRPAIRDAVYQVGREALANSFRHANPKRVEIEFEYSASGLDLHVRDDGCGIESTFIKAGRPGHWGLSGMRDRAEEIGGTLTLLTRARAGTEIKLSVPAELAFTAPEPRRWRRWF